MMDAAEQPTVAAVATTIAASTTIAAAAQPAAAAAAVDAADAAVAAPLGAAFTSACGGVGAPPGGVATETPAAGMEAAEPESAELRLRNGVAYAPKKRERGALIAPSRTGEGHRLPSGTGLTCLVDATYNGIMTLAPSIAPSRQRMLKLAVPELGNVRQASWASTQAALRALGYSVALVEATARFNFKASGGPMLTLLRARRAVLVVGLHVRIDGVPNEHCVLLSTVAEPHAPHGKLIDNHGQMRPVYIEPKDFASKPAAARAFRTLIEQNPAARYCSELTVEVSDVYELVRLGGGAPEPPSKRPAGEALQGDAKRARALDGARLCAACGVTKPTNHFSKTQRAKGPSGRCRECVG